MKVISLVPSITEALFDLGLTENEVIGRTKFCIHPKEKIQKIEKIGGTKNLNIKKIKILQPDLIIANKEENDKTQIEELSIDFNVLITDISNLVEQNQMLEDFGILFKKEKEAGHYKLKISEVLEKSCVPGNFKAAYLIWKNPYMTVGSDTYIHDVLTKIGFRNVFQNRKRYPEIDLSDLAEADVIFLSSEPFPFKQKHVEELKHIFPDKKIMIVDGEAFSWYGTRISKCENYFQTLKKQLT